MGQYTKRINPLQIGAAITFRSLEFKKLNKFLLFLFDNKREKMVAGKATFKKLKLLLERMLRSALNVEVYTVRTKKLWNWKTTSKQYFCILDDVTKQIVLLTTY